MEWFWNIINQVLAIIGYETSWELISGLFSNPDSYEPFASYEINWPFCDVILMLVAFVLIAVAVLIQPQPKSLIFFAPTRGKHVKKRRGKKRGEHVKKESKSQTPCE